MDAWVKSETGAEIRFHPKPETIADWISLE
jgi:hypothetical protein